MIACALVTALFLASAVLVPTIVRRLKLPPRNKKILAAAILFSLFAKLAVTQFSIVTMPELAYQGDYATWKTVAGLMAEHKNIYVERSDVLCDVPYLSCYNFAPAWAWIALGLDRISTFLHGQTIAAFRLTLTAFLAATDVLIALVLAGEYSYKAALVYLLAPVIMWTEAYEGNFNNLALLVALLAWVLIRWEKPTSRAVFLSAVLTGLSLTIKHILALFPVWLLFYKPLGKLRHRLAYAAIAYGIFFCSFLPWWFDPASRNGIMERVFRYNGNYGFSVVGRVTAILVPISRLDAAFHWLPLLSAFKLFWLILLIVIGMLAAKRNTNELLLCYLLALYGFSIGLFDEYLMIPMLVCAIFYKSWASWAFMLSSAGVMVTRIASLLTFRHNLPALDILGGRYEWQSILALLSTTLVFASQSCIIALVVLRGRDRFGPETSLPMPAMILRSAGLALTTSLFWLSWQEWHRVWPYISH